MGAGRSGTTALASFINAADDIVFLGELHHLPDYIEDNLNCSCGKTLRNCDSWRHLNLNDNIFTNTKYREQQRLLESHKYVIKYLFTDLGKFQYFYQDANAKLLKKVTDQPGQSKMVCLDSAKYIGRAIALSRNKRIDIRVIYMTRDPRGVASSFAKKVQTHKGTISVCIYYNVINFLAELASRTVLKGRVCKLRYEDLLTNPLQVFDAIESHAEVELHEVRRKIHNNESFDIGHIVGGNRLKSQKSIRFRNSDNWHETIHILRRWAIYFLTLPFNFLNRYKL